MKASTKIAMLFLDALRRRNSDGPTETCIRGFQAIDLSSSGFDPMPR